MSRLNPASSAIAFHGARRQVELMRRVKRLAVKAERVATELVNSIAKLVAKDGAGVNHNRAKQILAQLPHVLVNLIYEELRDILAWSRTAALRTLILSMPELMRQRVIAQNMGVTESRHARLFEREPREEFPFDLFDEELNRLFRELVFPPPPEEQINRIIFGTDWANRIASISRLADPHLLGTTVAIGLAQGKTQQEIIRDLLPIVGNVASSAKRIARTVGVHVGHEVQMTAWDELGDMVIGYELHHPPNPGERWWHVDRDKNVYYKEPQAGQLGLFDMPRPPLEPLNPEARPAGTPAVAFNCLCYISPLLSAEYTA